MKKVMAILAIVAVAMLVPVVPARADTVPTWFTGSGTTTWTSTSGGTGDGLRTINGWQQGWMRVGDAAANGATLNQTGGTITNTASFRPELLGAWYMTNNAKYQGIGNAAFPPHLYGAEYLMNPTGTYTVATWSLTDTAQVNLAATAMVGLSGGGGPAHILLGGGAAFTAANITFNTLFATGDVPYSGPTNPNDYLSFASGSTATLTVANKVLSDYQALVAAGNIRVDELAQSDFSKFQVAGNTLSLAPTAVPEPASLGLMGLALLAVRKRRS